jgi:formate dehydrogenase alpha subunit
MMSVTTTCIYCGVGCLLRFKVRDGEIVRTIPSHLGPGDGKLCIKGWSAHEFIHHEDRLKRPLIRRGEELVEASWDDALNLITENLSKTKNNHGSNSIAVLSSAKATNEENYLLQKFTRAVIGTNNIDHCARLCHASTISGLVKTFGSGAMTNSQEDLEEADVIFIIGSNTTEQHPLLSRRLIRAVKNGSKLIVADPRDIHLTAYSTLHMRHRPGTDVALLNAMMSVIIKEGLHDATFIENRTEGFQDLKNMVAQYEPDQVETLVTVPAEKIAEAARIYGEAERATILFSMGITQHITGVDNVVSVANLAMLTGNIGRSGTGVNPLRGQNNVQGACDMGALPQYFPGYRSVNDEEAGNQINNAWGASCSPEQGLTLMEIINECGKSIKTMYIMGENPVLSDPDSEHVKEQLKKLDFLAISELFLSETAELADVVLSAASFAEKSGTFTATDRRVQLIRKAIDPIGESKPDWKIITQLSKRMGYEMDYDSPQEIMEEITRVTPIYGGMKYERLESEGLRWPCPDPEHPGTPILHENQFARGKGLFVPVAYSPPAEEPDNAYPYILTTGRILPHWHTGTMTRRSPTLTNQVNEAYVEINPIDAETIGIIDGERVTVESRRGKITLKATVTEGIKEGVVFIPFHFSEAAANVLTNTALDPIAKIPELKVCAVNIIKA